MTIYKTFDLYKPQECSTLKVSVDRNYGQFRKEQQQDRAINEWYRDLNLTALDIERHPCISDLAILTNIHRSYWHLMTSSERMVWTSSWANVYRYRRFIRPKTLKKFEALVLSMPRREQRLLEQRTLIQSLRHTNTEPLKRDQDNEANGSHSHSLHKQTVAYESASECPYF